MAGKHKPIGDGSADPGEDEERDAAGGGQTEHGASHSILQGFVKISGGWGLTWSESLNPTRVC